MREPALRESHGRCPELSFADKKRAATMTFHEIMQKSALAARRVPHRGAALLAASPGDFGDGHPGSGEFVPDVAVGVVHVGPLVTTLIGADTA